MHPLDNHHPIPPLLPEAPAVLIVDDEPEAREILRLLVLEELDSRATILEAANGREAILLTRRRGVDVALVDYLLPDADGLEVLAALRQTAADPATILITGSGSETVAARAIQLGAYEYLHKSDIASLRLGHVIRGALAARQMKQQTAELAEQVRRNHDELDYLVRALSHDMGANFMMMAHSFRHLKRSAEATATPELSEDIERLDACMQQSQRFLDDLITLGKTGSVDMEPTRVELTEVVRSVLFEQHELLAERDIQTEVDARLPVLWCNRDRVKQIVTNLVRNAARHGCDPQQPIIRIRGGEMFGQAGGTSASLAWFRVADNGRGIPVKQRTSIFQPGERLASAHAEGSGMGLAIVDKLTRHFGGKVRVLAGDDGGAVFEVALPMARADSTSGSEMNPGQRVDGAQFRGPKHVSNSKRIRRPL